MRRLLISLLAIFILVACEASPTAAPTQIPIQPNETLPVEPTEVTTNSPTNIPIPTSTLTTTPHPIFGDPIYLGRSIISTTALSPDNAYLVVGSSAGFAVYDTESLQELWFTPTPLPVTTVQWQRDSTAFYGLVGTKILKWDTQTGEEQQVAKLRFYADEAAFNPDLTLIAAYNELNTSLFEVATGEIVHTFEDTWGQYLAWSPDGSILAIATRLWDVGEQKFIEQEPTESGSDFLTAIAFSADGSQFVIGTTDQGELPFDLVEPGLSGAEITIWDTASGEILQTWHPNRGVASVAFSPSGTETVYTTFDDDMIRSISSDSGELIRAYEGAGTLTFNADGSQLWAASVDGISLFDPTSGEKQGTIGGYSSPGYSFTPSKVEFSPDGNFIATNGYSRVNIWDAHSGEWLRSLEPGGIKTGLSWSADSQLIGIGLANPVIWEAQTGQRIAQLDDGLRRLFRHSLIAFSPTDPYLVASTSGNFDEYAFADMLSGQYTNYLGDGDRINLWNARTGELIRPLIMETPVSALQWSSNGDRLAVVWVQPLVGGTDSHYYVTIFNAAGEELTTFEVGIGYGSDVEIQWIPGQSVIVARDLDYEVHQWDTETGLRIEEQESDFGWFSSDGRYMATVDNNKIILWDATTHQRLDEYTHPEIIDFDFIVDVMFSPNGRQLIIATRSSVFILPLNL